eukprot:jgi/Ulvmu1/2751/UM014_0209.1
MQSQRTAVVVSLIIGLAIGIAILMVLWLCAACFSKSRTKDDDQQSGHAEATRSEHENHPDAVTPLPEARKHPYQAEQDKFPASHEYDGKLASKTPVAPYPAASTPPPVTPIDTRPAGSSAYPMASPDPMPTRLSHHAAALPTPSPIQPSETQQSHAAPGYHSGAGQDGRAVASKACIDTSGEDTSEQPRKTSPVVATLASPSVQPQEGSAEARSYRPSSARPRSNRRPSLAELDPMVPTVGRVSEPRLLQEALAVDAPHVTNADDPPAQPASVPALNLNSITEERTKRNASINKRSYALEPDASVLGTAVEIDAVSPVPGLPHTVSHVDRGDSVKDPMPQMPVDGSQMHGISGFDEGPAASAKHQSFVPEAKQGVREPAMQSRTDTQQPHGTHVDVSVSPYEDAADTRGMTAIMGDQTAVMMSVGPSKTQRENPLSDVQEHAEGAAATGSLPRAAVSDSLPPGAVVRGRDQFLDQLQTKPTDATGSIAPIRYQHQDTTGIFASPWDNSEQGPRGGSRSATYVPSDSTSVMSGGSGMSSWTLSSHAQARSVRRSAFSTMPTSSRSGRWSSRASNIAPTSSGHSNWTLSGDKTNWTLSGADKSTFTTGGEQSNWTLSGNTGNLSGASRRVATRPLDDGRSEAFTLGFTDGASEWGLSPRGTVRDDVGIGHSERWLQNDEIVVPSRVAGSMDDQPQRTGLRQKYEQRKLRQQYAADDTTVPETALRRVDEWMGDMSSTRDEVVKRLLAQTNDDE